MDLVATSIEVVTLEGFLNKMAHKSHCQLMLTLIVCIAVSSTTNVSSFSSSFGTNYLLSLFL